MRFCENCGYELSNEKYCPSCGTMVQAQTNQPNYYHQETQPQYYGQEPVQNNDNQNQSYNQNPNQNQNYNQAPAQSVGSGRSSSSKEITPALASIGFGVAAIVLGAIGFLLPYYVYIIGATFAFTGITSAFKAFRKDIGALKILYGVGMILCFVAIFVGLATFFLKYL